MLKSLSEELRISIIKVCYNCLERIVSSLVSRTLVHHEVYSRIKIPDRDSRKRSKIDLNRLKSDKRFLDQNWSPIRNK